MAFITGLFALDAPASALNNAGLRQGGGPENEVEVKFIRTKEGAYPYVSAQAFRYWLRETLVNLAKNGKVEWVASPIFREAKVAYTDANPILYWDDDLFGYMRAQGRRQDAAASRAADASRSESTPVDADITRVSPFRVSTLVSIAPVSITRDEGFMSRHEGDPVPHTHQFYRATLRGLISLDLHAVGTFSYREKTGFKNLDTNRIQMAKEQNLEHLLNEKSYRLSLHERVQRVASLLEGLAQLEGGAKLALHYTDVTPPFAIMAVTQGGNHIFNYVLGTDSAKNPRVNLDALQQAIEVYRDTLLSPIYIGWVQGYLDEQRQTVIEALDRIEKEQKVSFYIDHPRRAFQKVAEDLRAHPNWLE